MKIFIIIIAIIIFIMMSVIFLFKKDQYKLLGKISQNIDIILKMCNNYSDEYESMIKLIISFLYQFITNNTDVSLYKLENNIVVNFFSDGFYYILSIKLNEYLHIKLIEAICNKYSLEEFDKSLRDLICNVEFKLVRYKFDLEENNYYVFHGESECIFWNNFTVPMNPAFSNKKKLKLLKKHYINNNISLINDIRIIKQVSMHIKG